MDNFVRKSSLVLVYIASFLLMLIVLATVYNVCAFGLNRVARLYGYSVAGLPGYEEFVKLSVGCVALMYFPYTQYKRGHISVDFFSQKLSNRVQVLLDKTWLFVTFCFVVFLSIFMFIGMLENYEDATISSVLGWSIWPFYIPGIISLALWSLILICQVLWQDRSNLHV